MAPDSQHSGKDTPLLGLVFQRIQKSHEKSIPFSDYLELVLYHPEWGYYGSPGERAVGRSGDFYTSVSVGETYGFLLARRIREEMHRFPIGEKPFRIVEQGAHDGRLARDIVKAFSEGEEGVDRPWEYVIVEPRERVAEMLRNGVGETKPIRVVSSFAEIAGGSGIFLCNELLDAFPFDRLIRESGEWKELRVGLEGTGLAWRTGPIRDELAGFLEGLPADLPDGYTTEVCPAMVDWIAEASGLFENGLWWIVDYGFEADDYYAPHRSSGTFRCYRDHRASEDPFAFPGETDVTAHVNFSVLREAGEAAGLIWEDYTDQHHFLTEAARSWLLSQEGKVPDAAMAKRLRQFQTLTHPGMMGKQFKVATFRRT